MAFQKAFNNLNALKNGWQTGQITAEDLSALLSDDQIKMLDLPSLPAQVAALIFPSGDRELTASRLALFEQGVIAQAINRSDFNYLAVCPQELIQKILETWNIGLKLNLISNEQLIKLNIGKIMEINQSWLIGRKFPSSSIGALKIVHTEFDFDLRANCCSLDDKLLQKLSDKQEKDNQQLLEKLGEASQEIVRQYFVTRRKQECISSIEYLGELREAEICALARDLHLLEDADVKKLMKMLTKLRHAKPPFLESYPKIKGVESSRRSRGWAS